LTFFIAFSSEASVPFFRTSPEEFVQRVTQNENLKAAKDTEGAYNEKSFSFPTKPKTSSKGMGKMKVYE